MTILARNCENFPGIFLKVFRNDLGGKIRNENSTRNFAVLCFFLYFHVMQNFLLPRMLCLSSERFSGNFRGFAKIHPLIFVLTLMQVLRMRGFDGDFLKRRAGDEEEEEGESSCVDWSNHRVMEWLRQVPPLYFFSTNSSFLSISVPDPDP